MTTPYLGGASGMMRAPGTVARPRSPGSSQGDGSYDANGMLRYPGQGSPTGPNAAAPAQQPVQRPQFQTNRPPAPQSAAPAQPQPSFAQMQANGQARPAPPPPPAPNVQQAPAALPQMVQHVLSSGGPIMANAASSAPSTSALPSGQPAAPVTGNPHVDAMQAQYGFGADPSKVYAVPDASAPNGYRQLSAQELSGINGSGYDQSGKLVNPIGFSQDMWGMLGHPDQIAARYGSGAPLNVPTDTGTPQYLPNASPNSGYWITQGMTPPASPSTSMSPTNRPDIGNPSGTPGSSGSPASSGGNALPGATTGNGNEAGNYPGDTFPLQGSLQQTIADLLKNPSAFNSDAVKQSYDTLSKNIDDQYAVQQKDLTDEMAKRGMGAIGDSTIGLGRLSDLNIGQRSAKTQLADQLLGEQARSLDGARQGAIGDALNYGLGSQGLNIQGKLANNDLMLRVAALLSSYGYPTGQGGVSGSGQSGAGSGGGNAGGGSSGSNGSGDGGTDFVPHPQYQLNPYGQPLTRAQLLGYFG